ncbi:MAG: 3-hydroxyacyl-ACP dehydratase FabZ [Candidatus Bipolaricaulota bacterium]
MKLNIEEIKDRIALRYPYLLLDRVIEVKEEEISAVKNVTINEPYFQGHFPEPRQSIMPGTMIIESMAQAAGILAFHAAGKKDIGFLTGVENAKFRKKVTPGHQLILEGQLVRRRAKLCKTSMHALVEGELAAEARLTLALPEGE